ncbi:hypothetical protein SHI21_19690 [Bacteriovorax sp. PP10]|uniref:Cytochrome c domain-containing protein n=1 Tax=Bacteriovorax antarcticus TaxID=3088717 RepID=A0ABU5W1R0_9BACT|nr:hypothetical protein [Bacteriovorax sp. PP10]MEA9358469.1 hypothetical protein [Bacteriovorax sp. PP10]
MKFLTFSIFILFTPKAFSYSELSRHGYVNCTTCHLSPSGGGLLTPYGRELSKAALSTWGAKQEQYFAYNAFPKISKSDQILVGAYIRGLQAYRKDDQADEARAILMQADADIAYNAPDWAVVGSIGRQEIRKGLDSDSRLFSRRHYGIYRITSNHQLRAGKFLKFYGLNDPNHQLYVRRLLNFGFDSESYNFEYSYQGEALNLFATAFKGNFKDKFSLAKEKGISLSASYFLYDKQKLGLSLYNGADNLSRRNVYGIWGIFSYHPQFFSMHEFDLQNKTIKSLNQKQDGFVTSNKVNYEPVKGIIGFLNYDLSNLNPRSVSSKKSAYGSGLQLFPRPHFEIITAWQKEEIINLKTKSDLYSLLVHFYL